MVRLIASDWVEDELSIGVERPLRVSWVKRTFAQPKTCNSLFL